MSKIVSITGRPLASTTRIQPTKVLHHLRALWLCRSISMDAYFLGNIIIGVMQQRESMTVSFNKREACEVYAATPNGQVFSGMVSPQKLDFTMALQDLHFVAGIMSGKTLDDFDDSDSEKRHFTRSPLSARSHYDDETELFFRSPKDSEETYATRVTELFRSHFQQADSAVTIAL